MVVGVEPLGHFQWLLLNRATSQSEVGVDVQLAIGVAQFTKAGRDGANVGDGVQHLIVVREGAGNGSSFTQSQLGKAAGGAQLDFLSCSIQLGGINLVRPEALNGLLKLAAAANARVAQQGGGGECRGV